MAVKKIGRSLSLKKETLDTLERLSIDPANYLDSKVEEDFGTIEGLDVEIHEAKKLVQKLMGERRRLEEQETKKLGILQKPEAQQFIEKVTDVLKIKSRMDAERITEVRRQMFQRQFNVHVEPFEWQNMIEKKIGE